MRGSDLSTLSDEALFHSRGSQDGRLELESGYLSGFFYLKTYSKHLINATSLAASTAGRSSSPTSTAAMVYAGDASAKFISAKA